MFEEKKKTTKTALLRTQRCTTSRRTTFVMPKTMSPRRDENERIQATESDDDNLNILLDDADEYFQPLKDLSPKSVNKSPTASILKRTPSYGSINGLDTSQRTLNSGRGRRLSMACLDESSTNCNSELPQDDASSHHSLHSCLSSSQNGSMRRVSSTVSFQSVEVRNYSQTIGDNPSCMSGPAVSLDWDYSEEASYSVDEFETSGKRTNYGRYPRRMPKVHRENLLKNELGYSDEEIAIMKKEAKKIKRSVSMTKLFTQFGLGKVQDLVAKKNEKKLKKIHQSMNDLTISSSRVGSLGASGRSIASSSSSQSAGYEESLNF